MAKIDPIVPVLKKFRNSMGLSQQQMADKSGMSLRTIQRLEAGETDMKLGQYRKIIEALGISDMDVSVALFRHEFATGKDLGALAQALPVDIRQVIVRFLVDLADKIKPR
ncbi:XRE family transcriptional regulator [Vibrio parahaemolyticus]|nr:XRE family transcriptional regulator [Vibrio parahaemolyticus]